MEDCKLLVGNAGWLFISDSFQHFAPKVDFAYETTLLPDFRSRYVLRK